MTALLNRPLTTPALLLVFNRPDTSRRVVERLRSVAFGIREVLEVLERRPGLLEINKHVRQKPAR
jgi:hypothetical protein